MTDFDHTLAPHEVRKIAADAFVFGFPLVLVDLVRRAHPVSANQVLHLPDDAADVAPGLRAGDPRTVQSSAWIDLSAGPMVVSLPAVAGRHLSITFIDAWGEAVPGLGDRPYPAEGQSLFIAGPGWRGELNTEAPVLQVATDAVWMVTRLLADNVADREAARALLASQRIGPYEGADSTPTLAPPLLEPPVRASVDAIADLPPEIFLHRLAVLLARHPHPQPREDLEALAQIGVTPGRPYVPPRRDSKAYQAAIRGLADGLGRVRHAATPVHPSRGWRHLYSLPPHHGSLERASAALSGLGAPAADSILHMICETDEDGRPLGAGECYELRFQADALPPVEAFWSLALHHRPPHGELLLHRYALSDRDRLQPEAGGGLRLLLQHTPPSTDRAPNWLPTPSGQFALVLQLFDPKASVLSGAWSPPPLRRVGAAIG